MRKKAVMLTLAAAVTAAMAAVIGAAATVAGVLAGESHTPLHITMLAMVVTLGASLVVVRMSRRPDP